jgi:hypothetical protein
MDNLLAGIGTSFPQEVHLTGGYPVPLDSDSAIVSTDSAERDHHSGHLDHRSDILTTIPATAQKWSTSLGVTGQLPPESVVNFVRNGWSTSPGIRIQD